MGEGGREGGRADWWWKWKRKECGRDRERERKGEKRGRMFTSGVAPWHFAVGGLLTLTHLDLLAGGGDRRQEGVTGGDAALMRCMFCTGPTPSGCYGERANVRVVSDSFH